MTDLSLTIAPKSDQLNADDLISGTMTIRVTKVAACPGSAEQPIAVYFEGDNNKPYKPCKSMRRVLVQVWGKDGTQYPGRAMTLYRDPAVQFGGLAVGGIRISHMSHVEKPITLALTATKAQRKPFTVQPLKIEAPAQPKTAAPRLTLAEWISTVLPATLATCQTHDEVAKTQAGKAYVAALAKASEAERASMQTHITAALDRIDAASVPFDAPDANAPTTTTDDDDGGWPGPDPEAMRREAAAV